MAKNLLTVSGNCFTFDDCQGSKYILSHIFSKQNLILLKGFACNDNVTEI